MPDLPAPLDRAPIKGDSACCPSCGNLPRVDTKPLSERFSKGEVFTTFVCGTPGCAGTVEIGVQQAQALHRAGLVMATPAYLKNVERVSGRMLHLMEAAENECDQIGAGRVALAVEKIRLKAVGILDDAPKVLQQNNTFIQFEPGDPIDRRLEAMARERAIPADVVPPAFPPDDPPIEPPEEDGDTDEATGVL